MPKIGGYIFTTPGDVGDKLKMMKDAGFEFVCFGTTRFFRGDIIPEMIAKAGLWFDNIHLTGDKTNLIWSDTEDGEAICRRYCDEIKRCAEGGIKKGIVHVTWGKSVLPENPGPVGFDRYTRIGEVAAKYGFTVCVENSIFPEHFHAVLDRFTGPEFAHCFDCGHWNAFMKNEKVIETYGNRLAATHIHDNDGVHDLHMLPFDGCADWEDIAGKFAGAEFSRNMICSEFLGAREIKYPGKTKEKLEKVFSCLKIYGTPELQIEDGRVLFYPNVPEEELVARLYTRMKTLSDMIDEKAGK